MFVIRPYCVHDGMVRCDAMRWMRLMRAWRHVCNEHVYACFVL